MIGTHAISSAKELIRQAYHSGAERWKSKHEEAVGTVVATAEILGSSFGTGYMRGLHGEEKMKIAGAPGEVVVGLLGKVGALMGFGGGWSEHVDNISTGMLAAYATIQGHDKGAEAAAKKRSGATAAHGTHGVGSDASGGRGWRDNELANIAAA